MRYTGERYATHSPREDIGPQRRQSAHQHRTAGQLGMNLRAPQLPILRRQRRPRYEASRSAISGRIRIQGLAMKGSVATFIIGRRAICDRMRWCRFRRCSEPAPCWPSPSPR